ncbi:condensin complex subunit 3-like [Haematobia irritans]|uniref:condensin complex subunit 3-like n=1 Tax=Haematobia irritans TaxID=7368 RepID=UPI003F4F3FB2
MDNCQVKAIYAICSKAQRNQKYHRKYLKDLDKIYKKMDHGVFIYAIIGALKSALEAPKDNEYALTVLLFLAKFIASYEQMDVNPFMEPIVFQWLLQTTSPRSDIRFRLCQFINIILGEFGEPVCQGSKLAICTLNCITEHYLNDIEPIVRAQALNALNYLLKGDTSDNVKKFKHGTMENYNNREN